MQLMNLQNGLRITFDLNVICIALSLIMPRQSLADELDFKKLGLNDTFKQDILNIEGIRNYYVFDEKEGAFRVYYPAGSFDPQSMKSKNLPSGGMNFKWAPFYSRNKECAIIQYSVRFPKSFDFVKGGKLPGLYGGNGNTGGKIPNGYDGFSVRLLWVENGMGKVYAYLPQEDKKQKWGVGLSGLPWFYPRGEWQNITLKVKLNTVNFQNGIVKLWVNNKLVIDRRDVLFRKTPNLKIDGVLFSTFFGGNNPSFAPKELQYLDFKDIKISDWFSKQMRCEHDETD
ncbi:polysaccharide lyase [Klebsiella pneumoniae]|uniref:polysaccharide lyase n=1 Tax=Klebsiella pneumoniae TaxID=573 RepID=UPI0031316EC4